MPARFVRPAGTHTPPVGLHSAALPCALDTTILPCRCAAWAAASLLPPCCSCSTLCGMLNAGSSERCVACGAARWDGRDGEVQRRIRAALATTDTSRANIRQVRPAWPVRRRQHQHKQQPGSCAGLLLTLHRACAVVRAPGRHARAAGGSQRSRQRRPAPARHAVARRHGGGAAAGSHDAGSGSRQPRPAPGSGWCAGVASHAAG
jgi:hypothetical protein